MEPRLLVPLCLYLQTQLGEVTGLSYIDSTSLVVCSNKRINRHRVFQGLAQRGKTTTGWFFGFKLHLVINHKGEISAFQVTPGNVDDRQPVPQLVTNLFGKLLGDKGYLSQALSQQLRVQGLELFTSLRRHMKNRLIKLSDKILLRKRAVSETVNDQLKNQLQIEHTRHRSVVNFCVNLLSALAAYTHQPHKPKIQFSDRELAIIS